MLDYFAVFSRGGALLWALQFTALRHSPIEALNALIRACLLEERSGENTFTYTPKAGAAQALKWTFHNGLGLVFVAVYQKTLSLLYVDELLKAAKDEFCTNHYQPGCFSYKPSFDDALQQLLKECEQRAEESKRGPQASRAPPPKGAKGQPASNGQAAGAKTSKSSKGGKGEEDDTDGADVARTTENGTTNSSVKGASDTDEGGAFSDTVQNGSSAFNKAQLEKLKGKGKGGPKSGASKPAPASSAAAKPEVKEAPKKKGRVWGLAKGEEPSKLDFCEDQPEWAGGSASDAAGCTTGASDSDFRPSGRGPSASMPPAGPSRMDVEEVVEDAVEEEDEEVFTNAGRNGSTQAPAASRSVLGSFVSSLAMRVVGKQALTAEDLAPALVDMKRKLMERNVAEQIAQHITDSVGKSLEGQKLSSFTGVSAFVRRSFEDALSGILNKRQVDVLLDIQKSQAKGRPYVIVFCGVNGVGKSTNLAKIAYWLGQHNVKVMVAACDTFRAGAVEQLKTHCSRLRIPLYERGYERDPAKVANEAIKQAEREGTHVVLVDTAGRMQDNEPLMRALSSLINVNEPNLVLFVGEALVGNDAVDQLVKFNRALYDLAPPHVTNKHVIDGIVLTKFDTIDDKVGAAVSMVYSSGAPIMFLGCGQTYVDLKKLNVKSVVNSLLK